MDEQPARDPVVASPVAQPARYPFSVLAVLATAFRVTKANLVPFLILASVLEVPTLLVQLNVDGDAALLGILTQMITNSLTSAVVTYGVIMELQGSRPSTRVCIVEGFAQIGRVLGVTLISGLVVGVATLMLVVPGVIVALMFYVIIPVTVVERLGIDAAMKRSRKLTNGRKGDLFLIVLFAVAIGGVVEYVAQTEFGPYTAIVWRAIGSALCSMYFSVCAAVVYVVLRQQRDGTMVPELATALARIRT
jgi:hypothetical protein